jgi:hypothetical protein
MSRYSTRFCPYGANEHTNKMRKRLMSLPFCVLAMDISCANSSMESYVFTVCSLCFRFMFHWGEVRLRGAPETQVSFHAWVARPGLHLAHARSVDTAVALHCGAPGLRRSV